MMMVVAAITGAHSTLRWHASSRIGDNAGSGLKVRVLQGAAAVLAATAVCAGVMVSRLAALLAIVCGRAQGSVLGQDALFNAATAAWRMTISELILETTK